MSEFTILRLVRAGGEQEERRRRTSPKNVVSTGSIFLGITRDAAVMRWYSIHGVFKIG